MKSQDQKGAVAIEFAFILPVLVLMLFGIVELSLLFYNKQIITNASREGARYGIVGETSENIAGRVNEYCAGHLITFGSGTVGVTPEPNSPAAGYLTVTVTYPYDFLVLGNFFGFDDSVALTAKTVMRMEPE